MKGLKHKKISLKIQLEEYTNNTACITLLERNDDEYLTLSTNLNSHSQDEEHIFIKQGDDHLEIAEAMEKLGLLIATNEFEGSGYNSYQRYQLTPLLFKNSEKV